MSSATSVANCPVASVASLTGGSSTLLCNGSSRTTNNKSQSTNNNNYNNNNIEKAHDEETLQSCKAEESQLRPTPGAGVVQPGAQVQQVGHQLHEATAASSQQQRLKQRPSGAGHQLTSVKELELLERENSELKTRARKLQLEIDEKNEIISVLRDELETSKEQADKLQRDNLQLLKDSKRASFLQDENDFLQDKVGKVESLECEIGRLKEKLAELEFLRLRIVELQEDRQRAQDEAAEFEERCKRAEEKLARVVELEGELNKWKLFSHDLETQRNSIQTKLLTSIEQETKLQSNNKKVEDEVIRLRTLIKKYEEQRDEQQASNSLSIIDLNKGSLSTDGAHLSSLITGASSLSPQAEDHSHLQDTSIQFELDKQLEKEVQEENRNLKQKLNQTEGQLHRLEKTNQVIRDELSSNRKLISELRQDLACEKNVALKLTNQLVSFTKQIKNLDKNYLHSCKLDEKSIIDTSQVVVASHTNEQQPASQDNKLIIKTPANKQEPKESSLSNGTELQDTTTQDGNSPIESKKMVSLCNSEQLNNCKVTTNTNSSDSQNGDNELKPGDSLTVTGELDNKATLTKQQQQQDNNESKELSKHNAKQEPHKKDTFFKNDEPVKPSSPILLTEKSASEDEGKTQGLVKNVTPTNDGLEEKERKETIEALNNLSKLSESGLKLVESNSSLIERLSKRDEQSSRAAVDQERLKSSQKHQGVNIDQPSSSQSNNNNNNNSNSKLNLTSLSSSSATNRSQNSSPSAVVTCAGHDSGFQSINHDLNQSSTAKTDAWKTTSQSPVADLASISHTDAAAAVDPVVEATAAAAKLHLTDRSAAIIDGSISTADSFKTLRSITPPSKFCNREKSKSQDAESQVKNDLIRQQKQRQQTVISGASTNTIRGSSNQNNTLTSSQAAVGKHPPNDALMEAHLKLSDTVSKERSFEVSSKEVETATARHNFLRNSKSSRSVNFGSSRPVGYLDRIRASLTATTTTSSYNQHQEQQSSSSRITAAADGLPHSLNCMLKHLHSERCFLNHHPQHHQHQLDQSGLMMSDLEHPAVLNSSRQLNALIDPVSHQRLMMNMMQQQQQRQHVTPSTELGYQATGSAMLENLTPEQQRQQMALLHHQHYYHHLQHMHQLHQMHHMHLHHHHLHHQYQQQQQQQHTNLKQQKFDTNGTGLEQKQNLPAANQLQSPQQQQRLSHHQQQPLKESINGVCIQSAPQTARICEPIYTGGSQFQASAMSNNFDGLYANVMVSEQPGMQSINQQQAHQHHKNTKLVNEESGKEQANCSVKSSPIRQVAALRMSPIKCQQHSSSSTNNNACYMLPQIDEVNGLPTFDGPTHAPVAQLRLHHQATKERQFVGGGSPLRAASADPKRHTAGSASSTSPTSSGSPNLSPSSASSSSSLNSLSTSSAPLTRSALRRTTTDGSQNRRQFSVERELAGPTPLTATLSRVGSCRMKQGTDGALEPCIFYPEQQHNSSAPANGAMQVPVKCQQPSMRTSKILNIAHQSPQHNKHPSPQPPPQSQSPISGTQRMPQESKFIRGVTGGAEKKLLNNLANIRLNNSLAFTSLREPKRFSDKLLNKLSTATSKTSNCTQQRLNTSLGTPTSMTTAAAAAASQDKQKRLSLGSDASTTRDISNGGNKSSVWFEYGCI